jgi:predicted phosphate transport protein (TIGR00153 family)
MVFGINLLPQDNKFFELLIQTSELSNASIHLLKDLTIEDDREKAFKLAREIETAKHKAKEVTYEITERLCRTLMTPFDHEDIHRLSRGLYKILKICEKAQERLIAFQLRPFQNDFFKLTSNMVEASDVVHDLVKSLKKLKDSKPIHDKCALIHNIEANTDQLLNQLTIDLYHYENDFKQILIRKEMYNLMESIVDRHRDVANVILEVVLKHS